MTRVLVIMCLAASAGARVALAASHGPSFHVAAALLALAAVVTPAVEHGHPPGAAPHGH